MTSLNKPLVFAVDPDSGSLGWAVYELDDNGNLVRHVAAGTWIFSTGRNPRHASNASSRNNYKRRMRQGYRRVHDRKVLDTALRNAGFIPPHDDDRWKEFLGIPPLEARVAATSGRTEKFAIEIAREAGKRNCDESSAEKVATSGVDAKYIIGRALRDLAKNRGYAITRSLDRTSDSVRKNRDQDDEKTKTGPAKAALRAHVATRTGDGKEPLCHWLLERHKKTRGPAGSKGKKGRRDGQSRRFRKGTGADPDLYEFFPEREMIEHEIRLIRERNADFATPEQWDEIERRMTWQRPLKRPPAGKCTFCPDEERLPKWHLLVGEFRILQELNGLRTIDNIGEKRPLDKEVRDLALAHLMSGEDLTWSQFRKLAKIPATRKIDLEEEGMLKLVGHETILALRGNKRNPGVLADAWDRWKTRLESILEILDGQDPDALDSLPTDDPETVTERLVKHVGMDRKLATEVEKIGLPKGRSHLGTTAIKAIVEIMRVDGCVYSDAVETASERNLLGEFAHHSKFNHETNLDLEMLPRYNTLPFIQNSLAGTGDPTDPVDKRLGTITNPTVHIWLGQFMHAINALIKRFGKPAKIVIESPRDIIRSEEELVRADRVRNANAKRNERFREELAEHGREPSESNLLRLRLWEELGKSPADRVEVFTGRPISFTQALDDTEVEHILPWGDTLDNSLSNKTLAFSDTNSKKGKRAPADVWSGDELEAIIARVLESPRMRSKLWRFLPDAMEWFENVAGFEDRQLAATGWMTCLIRDYAEALFPKDGKRHVEVPRGWMTARLRHEWGLYLSDKKTGKDRNDHRHHALDAIALAALAQPGMIQGMITHERMKDGLAKKAKAGFPEPYEGFGREARERVALSQTGHRPLHRIGGTFSKEGLYGRIRDLPENAADLAIGSTVMRTDIPAMSPLDLRYIRHRGHRAALAKFADIADDKERSAALREWCKENGPRAMRVIKPNKTAHGIRDRKTGKTTRFAIPHQYAFVDIIANDDGEWEKRPFTLWDAMSGEHLHENHVHPDPGFKMRLFKNDLIQMFDLDAGTDEIVPGTNAIYRVVFLNPSQKGPKLAGVNEAGNLEARHRDESDDFQWHIPSIKSYQASRARRVYIDRIGRVRTVPIGKI